MGSGLAEQNFFLWLSNLFDSLSVNDRRIMEINASLHQPITTRNTSNQWIPPSDGKIKVNFDASFNRSTLQSVSGIVLRDSNGLLMAAGTYPNSFILNPEMTEAFACEQALILSKDLGFRCIEVEGDALTVISEVVSPTMDRSLVIAVYSNISEKRTLSSYFSCMSIERGILLHMFLQIWADGTHRS
ncbi:uncharacterized protein LOC120208488 [Hibiscus syriacus]|uniref:uncharacterized protein LOC120208488 n=1 Tax=Hibiscus syriacus TaxID=106335 RepID=UPI0019235E7C|nr:uncharacterized protein LOC120208488 [Hibiscus syriacus]